MKARQKQLKERMLLKMILATVQYSLVAQSSPPGHSFLYSGLTSTSRHQSAHGLVSVPEIDSQASWHSLSLKYFKLPPSTLACPDLIFPPA